MYRSLLFGCLAISTLLSQTMSTNSVAGPYWHGGVRVESDFKKVTVHETYLEIEEEVELAPTDIGYGSPEKETQEKIQLTGTFAIPHNSVISGAVLWDGDKLLKAKLKVLPEAENSFKDTVLSDTTGWEHSSSDPLLISLHKRDGNDTAAFKDIYSIDLYSLEWGSFKRIRIRYIVPLQNVNNSQKLFIPHIFARATGPNAQRPENVIIELKGAPGVTSVNLIKDGRIRKVILSESPVTLIEPHEESIAFTIERNGFDSTGIIQKTVLDTGSLQGEFIHFYSRVPDELYTAAGLKREVVFLWRWENENSLVRWIDQKKEFTTYGYTMLDQAHRIRSTMVELLDAKAGVGMYLDRSDDGSDSLFQMAYKSTKEADTLLDFMNYIVSNDGYNIMSEISGYEVKNEDEGGKLTASEIDSMCQNGAEDFRIAIDSIETVFSKDSSVVKHIVLLTVGKRKTEHNKVFEAELEKLKDVTFSHYGTDSKYPDGYWPGVDMKAIADQRRLNEAMISNGFRLPKRSHANFTMTLKSDQNTHILEAFSHDSSDQYYDRIYFTGHTPGTWNDTIIWNAQDNDANDLATVIQTPFLAESANDTDLVMLWGGSSSSPYSESIKEKSIGSMVGFIDENFSLLAMPYDSLSEELQKLIEEGGDIPNLSQDEIDKTGYDDEPISITDKLHKKPFALIQNANGITFLLNTALEKNSSITIFDVRGRIIERFTFSDLLGRTEFFWNGISSNGKTLAAGMYIVHFVNGTNSYSLKLMH